MVNDEMRCRHLGIFYLFTNSFFFPSLSLRRLPVATEAKRFRLPTPQRPRNERIRIPDRRMAYHEKKKGYIMGRLRL